jgi:hypothetical protein
MTIEMEQGLRIINLQCHDFEQCWDYLCATLLAHEIGRYPDCLIIRRNGYEATLFRSRPNTLLRVGSQRDVPERLTVTNFAPVLRVH